MESWVYVLFSILFFYFYSGLLKDSKVAEKKAEEDYDIWPNPNNITFGTETISFKKDCYFVFKLQMQTAQKYTLDVFKLYHSIINKERIDLDFTILKCTIPITITINNQKIQKYTDKYDKTFESYSISIIDDKNISLRAEYLNGLIYAFETFSQIVRYNETGKHFEIIKAPIVINDYPVYGYRSIMIDTSRHFISVGKIKNIIDGMVMNKLNVFHWHLTDDEYFGFYVDYLKDKDQRYVYSRDNIQELIEYAIIRGITIIPEIDTPGHTRSFKDINSSMVILTGPESGFLDPSKNITYEIVSDILNQAIDVFSPGEDELFHLGGDEVNQQFWNTKDIEAFKQKNNITDLLDYYFTTIRKNLPEKRNYIYWLGTEGKQYKVYTEENSILMYWESQDLGQILKTLPNVKRKIIYCPGNLFYLDCGVGNKYGQSTWCGDYKTWRSIYDSDIFPGDQNNTVIGSALVLFGELADERSIIGKIFPRASSFAERLWTKDDKRNTKSAYLRMLTQNKRLLSRGVDSISFTSQLCENEPEACSGWY